jgi:NitT/TauT family transport system permease protein
MRVFQTSLPARKGFSAADGLVLLALFVLVYTGVRLAAQSPEVVDGPAITTDPASLPWYALLSVGRMFAAYVLSLLFTFLYGTAAARNKQAQVVLMPILDILQSVPILSFLPVVILSLAAILPLSLAVELSSIVLIFTSQAWNMTFAWYQSLTTIPKELQEAASIFRFNKWMRFRVLELPFAAIGLLWNSMMSWAGGWFFLMASEMFTVGQKDFRLPGLGAYLQEAASKGDMEAIAWGVGTLLAVIICLDTFVWRPLLAWSERFKLQMQDSEEHATSWFLNSLRASRLVGWIFEKCLEPAMDCVDSLFLKLKPVESETSSGHGWGMRLFILAVLAGGGYGAFQAVGMLTEVGVGKWVEIGLGLLATLARVWAALVIALAITLPLGLGIGLNKRMSNMLLPVVQVLASIPSTALFPVVLLALLKLPGGLALASVFLMLMGTIWYLLFNIMAGASAIPQELISMSAILKIEGWERWKTLYLPALFPYCITGAITATGGAWNASIVAEYVLFGGDYVTTTGLGSIIAQATAAGDYPLLLAATLVMVGTVVGFNRFFWRRLYRLAAERYVME